MTSDELKVYIMICFLQCLMNALTPFINFWGIFDRKIFKFYVKSIISCQVIVLYIDLVARNTSLCPTFILLLEVISDPPDF